MSDYAIEMASFTEQQLSNQVNLTFKCTHTRFSKGRRKRTIQAPLARVLGSCAPSATRKLFTSICDAIRTFSAHLQLVRYRLIRLIAALLASAPDALVLADARPPRTP